jgi:hypothetical protein
MAPPLPRAIAVAALSLLSLSSVTSAYKNYSSVDMRRAQLALMEIRPREDCPPWYGANRFPGFDRNSTC